MDSVNLSEFMYAYTMLEKFENSQFYTQLLYKQ